MNIAHDTCFFTLLCSAGVWLINRNSSYRICTLCVFFVGFIALDGRMLCKLLFSALDLDLVWLFQNPYDDWLVYDPVVQEFQFALLQ